MSLFAAIAKARDRCLADMERPVTLLVAESIKSTLRREIETPFYGSPDFNQPMKLMGMDVEWTKAKPLDKPQMAIRTDTGDTRIVTVLD